MKRVVAPLALALVAALASISPAHAGADGRITWLIPNWYAGVQMAASDPSESDPYLHARFKRVGGEGQRQVRMGERHKKPDSHQWTRYTYTRPVKLEAGGKVIFTTEATLPCEPAKEPVGIVMDMRIKLPGKPWSAWETWIAEDQILLLCGEDQ